MHLGRAVVTAVATIGARQLGQILPNSFCQPECREYLNTLRAMIIVALLELHELI
jgi:hypothetical protein